MSQVTWKDDVPVALAFDDPYYSLNDGAAEAAHVFVQGNNLPTRFAPGFHIAELGFGTGLNALVAGQAWAASGVPGKLRFTSFEAFPIAPDHMQKALAAFPQFAPDAAILAAAWREGATRIELPNVTLTVIKGDARETLPAWDDQADAWFLDGFSPAKNPQMWEPSLLAQVAKHTKPKGSFATYTAAGAVRRALEAAGFVVERRPGFAHKRHMSIGHL